MYSKAQWVDRSGQHVGIRCDIHGTTSFVPTDPSNSDYARIRKLVEDGELTIQPYAEASPP